MKKLIISFLSVLSLIVMVGCQEDEKSFGPLDPPINLQVTATIVGKTAENPNGDGSGLVQFTATAENAISYKYAFSDGSTQNAPNGVFEKRFTTTGLNTYTVTITASSTGGIATTTTMEIEVLSNFTDPEALQFLTGGTAVGKKWYWAASEPGHLGVGPNSANADQNYFGFWYQAGPFEKAGSPESSCLYENVMTFSLVDGQLKYQLDNGGRTFFNAAYQSVVGGTAGYDLCYNYTVGGIKAVNLGPSESVVMNNPDHATQTRGTMLNIADGGFMGYYIGQSSYEIMSITANRMVVRAIQGSDAGLAWYHTFTTTPPTQNPDTDYTNLVWSDEFNTDGAPDSSKWSYDLGAGGWGNNEEQFYTNSSSNVVVTGGNLKITAKAEPMGTSNYTSARIKSQNKYDFLYGKAEIRAKLPVGAGTWPAIWMLGDNIETVGWPSCGEIDIMEHRGTTPGVIHGSLHYPNHSGGNANTNTTTIVNPSTEFHVYKVIWSATAIKFYVDDALFHSFANTSAVPFNSNFFFIMNVAMGGNFGGTIAPGFTQSSMEVDYIRVYQ
jgi:beta-glucanase (GH16 family)